MDLYKPHLLVNGLHGIIISRKVDMARSKSAVPHLEMNQGFKRALELMENGSKSVFVTGRAGTGKSTLLEYFRNNTRQNIAVLAPTGVAALNVRGQTIHSFFGFKPDITLDKVHRVRSPDQLEIYNRLDIIVIDEVSMVRADLLDCVDRFLRLNGPHGEFPFGGIRMVFIGDLYQLPPVVTGPERQAFDACYETPYFYSAKALQSFDMDLVELEKIYRQHDRDFIDLLNSIRNNSVTQPQLDQLNTRYKPDFEPEEDDFYIYLTTTNQMAKEINASRLDLLDTPLYSFSAQIQGEFGKEYLPTAIELEVKTGAQVMLLNNDTAGRWVNGSVGKIAAIEPGEKEAVITVELQDGNLEKVTPNTWEIFRFFIEDGKLCTEPIGSFRQYPLMLAWAVTIHKSQGKTFEKVIIDIGKGSFAHGQTYVALSRCTTLDGIILKKPILKKHIWSDYRIPNFLTRYQYDRSEASFPVDEKMALIKQAIESGDLLEIVYLKPNDEKSQRTVRPLAVGEMQYCGKSYPGMRAFCTLKKAERTFRVDRILEIKKKRP